MNVDPMATLEVVYQATAYWGIGRIIDYVVVISEIMQQHCIKIPLEEKLPQMRKLSLMQVWLSRWRSYHLIFTVMDIITTQ